MTSARKRLVSASAVLALILISALSLPAQAPAGQKVLTLADYPRWKHVLSSGISPDGNWISYGLRPNGGDETLYFKSLAAEKIHEIAGGTRPAFSRDSKWAAYMINLPKADAEKLRKDKKPVPSKAELINLATGDKFTLENASSFAFSNDSKTFAARKAKPEGESKSSGTDLILRRLDTGATQLLGNVGEFVFNKPGRLLAYSVDAADKKGNGLYLLDPASGMLNLLDSAEMEYVRIAWDREGTGLAVLKGTKDKGFLQKRNLLVTFTGLGKPAKGAAAGPVRIEYDPSQDASFPKDMVLSEKGQTEGRRQAASDEADNPALSWSDDLSRIFCGIKEQENEPEESKEPVANVDVWHWKDERIQSEQMIQAERDRNFTYRSVFFIKEKKFLRLADGKMRTMTVTRDGRWGIGRDDKAYLTDVETMQADYYAVNVATGERRPIVQGIRHPLGDSPDGRYFLYMKDKQIWLHGLDTGKTANISEKSGVNFADEEDDHPEENPAYGVAGWTKDAKAVILNHKCDLWLLPLDGAAPKNLTAGLGGKDGIIFRIVRLDPEERFIDLSKPLLLSAYGEWTKKSGYFLLKPGAEPRRLVFEDKSYGQPLKARSSERLLYTRESFVDFPDYYVSGPDFADPKKVTDANPQQAEYAWGSRILIDYQNSRGIKLQGTLNLPAGYEKGRRYPMIVYIYEKQSQRHNQYSMPTYDDRPHMCTYASDGYLFLMPDVVYETGKPGTSALDCVTSAVNKVIDLGYADPKRIGLQGHSWGGFEAGYLVTQTDLFACVVAGAAPSSVAIEFNQIFKSSGNNNHSYYERSQGRMGTNPWKDPALFDSQSSIRQAERIKKPFLLLHGTDDGSVDWIESLEYYNAARRLGKQVIFLSYPGEPHHLAKEENQKDFLKRMKEYFDHYLKDAPPPDWMTNGLSFLKKKK